MRHTPHTRTLTPTLTPSLTITTSQLAAALHWLRYHLGQLARAQSDPRLTSTLHRVAKPWATSTRTTCCRSNGIDIATNLLNDIYPSTTLRKRRSDGSNSLRTPSTRAWCWRRKVRSSITINSLNYWGRCTPWCCMTAGWATTSSRMLWGASLRFTPRCSATSTCLRKRNAERPLSLWETPCFASLMGSAVAPPTSPSRRSKLLLVESGILLKWRLCGAPTSLDLWGSMRLLLLAYMQGPILQHEIEHVILHGYLEWFGGMATISLAAMVSRPTTTLGVMNVRTRTRSGHGREFWAPLNG